MASVDPALLYRDWHSGWPAIVVIVENAEENGKLPNIMTDRFYRNPDDFGGGVGGYQSCPRSSDFLYNEICPRVWNPSVFL